MANNRLFHAAALHKVFVLWKEQKKSISQEDLQRLEGRKRKRWERLYTVEPPNKGHLGANSFVPCREVLPISEVK